jgi:hypothetical protein
MDIASVNFKVLAIAAVAIVLVVRFTCVVFNRFAPLKYQPKNEIVLDLGIVFLLAVTGATNDAGKTAAVGGLIAGGSFLATWFHGADQRRKRLGKTGSDPK